MNRYIIENRKLKLNNNRKDKRIKTLETEITDLKEEVSHLIQYRCTRKQSNALKGAREKITNTPKRDWDSLVTDYENG